jgi:hypothetical protein
MIPALTSQGATVAEKMDSDKKAQDCTNISRFLASLIGLGILCSGCDHGTPSLAPVSGKVVFQNQPLPGGAIVFVPDADRGNNGPLAQGTIQPGGAYTLQTGGQAGAYPGWYRVTVIAVDRGYQSVGSAPRALVPEKYRDPQLSDLTCEVKEGQENKINFNLTP